MAKLDFVTIRLDVRSKYDGGKLDEGIEAKQIKGISVAYFNIGEGEEWESSVPFVILKEEGQME